MGRGVIEASLFRAEQVEVEERSSDPADPEPNEAWLRVDIKPEYEDADGTTQTGVAEYRVANADGSVDAAPVAQLGDTTGDKVIDKVRAHVDGGGSPTGTGFVPHATSDAAFGKRRLEHPSAGQVAMHNALTTTTIPDSGVSRWKFEQDLVDSWGDNDGTGSGGLTYTTNSQVGSYALDLDGADDYVSTPLAANFGTSTFSLSVWVNLDDLNENNFLSTYDGSTGILLENDPSSGYEFWLSGTNIFGSSTSGTYEHVVGVRDSSQMRLYVNGSPVSSTSADPDVDSTTDVNIGRRPDGSYYMTGLLDDPRVYDKALSDSEVSNLYNTGSISG